MQRINCEGRDAFSNKENLKYAITEWLEEKMTANDDVFIYLKDHGTQDGKFIIGASYIDSCELNKWINQLSYKNCVIFIDCCYSGNFINNLSKQGRIIITSTDKYGESWHSVPAGLGYFPKAFYDKLSEGNISFGEAWETADNIIDTRYKYKNQNPLIDDNGDGIGSGTSDSDNLNELDDGSFALKVYPLNDIQDDENSNNKSKPLFQRLIYTKILTFLDKL